MAKTLQTPDYILGYINGILSQNKDNPEYENVAAAIVYPKKGWIDITYPTTTKTNETIRIKPISHNEFIINLPTNDPRGIQESNLEEEIEKAIKSIPQLRKR